MFDFNITETNSELTIKLKGRLDATVAPQLHAKISEYQNKDIRKVTFEASELEYIASAGLRIIIFSKQKLGTNVEIFMKDVSEEVQSVIEMTGCDNFITFI